MILDLPHLIVMRIQTLAVRTGMFYNKHLSEWDCALLIKRMKTVP